MLQYLAAWPREFIRDMEWKIDRGDTAPTEKQAAKILSIWAEAETEGLVVLPPRAV